MHQPTKLTVTILAFCLLLIPVSGYTQTTEIKWINRNAHEIKSQGDNFEDLSFLSKILNNKTIIGLGEASHGTQEFYVQKSRLVKYLVTKQGYRLLAFEAPSASMQPINDYLLTGKGDLTQTLTAMGLYNSEELLHLFQWLKEYNQTKATDEKIEVIGFDEENYWSDPFNRDRLMAENFTHFQQKSRVKSILWAHNLHLAKDTTMAQFKAMGFYLKETYKTDYYLIFFDTYKGNVTVLNNGQTEKKAFNGSPNTLSYLLSDAKYNMLFLDFHENMHPLLNEKIPITNIYADWRGEPVPLPVIPGTDFDGLLYIRTTTASKTIE